MTKKVLAIGTLDTKGEELQYLINQMMKGGVSSLTLDAGVLGEPFFKADLGREQVAEKGGESLESLRDGKDRNKAVTVMSQGAARLAKELHARGEIMGVIGLGGSSGSTVASAAMQALPIGVPKLIVSTVASGNTEPFVGVKDITMMNSVIDIEGINRISGKVLDNAAGAMVGMVNAQAERREAADSRKLISASMMGVTTPCVNRARHVLESHGYETVVFHAIGTGGRAMEGMIEDGLIDGVLDITTGEIGNRLVGGVCDAGPNRLEAAGKKAVPQVVSCGGVDFVNFWANSVPEKFNGRHLYTHNPVVTLMRTTIEENAEIGRLIAEKVNLGTGPTRVMIPLKGFSSLDIEGGAFWNPEANQAFIDSLEKNVASSNVEVKKYDLHINDPEFADEAVAWLERTVK